MTKQEAVMVLTSYKYMLLSDWHDDEEITPEKLKQECLKAYELYSSIDVAIRALHFSIRAEKWLKEDEEENRK